MTGEWTRYRLEQCYQRGSGHSMGLSMHKAKNGRQDAKLLTGLEAEAGSPGTNPSAVESSLWNLHQGRYSANNVSPPSDCLDTHPRDLCHTISSKKHSFVFATEHVAKSGSFSV